MSAHDLYTGLTVRGGGRNVEFAVFQNDREVCAIRMHTRRRALLVALAAVYLAFRPWGAA